MQGRRAIDHTGQKFGNWTVLKRAPNKGMRVEWVCQCTCGLERKVNSYSLRSGRSQSCGKCIDIHGHAHANKETQTYRSWVNMRQRCTNPDVYGYSRYGGRGITFCERWNDFENFLADMGERPEGYSISRKDHDGNYEPSNCEWAPKWSH